MTMHAGQNQRVKDLIVVPLLDVISSRYQGEDLENILWAVFHCGSSRSIYDDFSREFVQLKQFHTGTIGSAEPSLDDLRLAIYEITIDYLQINCPQYHIKHPVLPKVDNFAGMEKIRILFEQYLTLTSCDSLERYKLAHEIILEKRLLGLPTKYPENTNIFDTGPGYAPGDFSWLDLSKLHLVRDSRLGNGNFKVLPLDNCVLDGTTFENIQLYGANFTDSSLRGASLWIVPDCAVFIGADIEGTYASDDWIPPSNARNRDKISNTEAELMHFRSHVLDMQETHLADQSDLTVESTGAESSSMSRADLLLQDGYTRRTRILNEFQRAIILKRNTHPELYRICSKAWASAIQLSDRSWHDGQAFLHIELAISSATKLIELTGNIPAMLEEQKILSVAIEKMRKAIEGPKLFRSESINKNLFSMSLCGILGYSMNIASAALLLNPATALLAYPCMFIGNMLMAAAGVSLVVMPLMHKAKNEDKNLQCAYSRSLAASLTTVGVFAPTPARQEQQQLAHPAPGISG